MLLSNWQDTERIRIEKTAYEVSLTIKKVMRTDDGEYSFRMANAAGETTSFAKLFVQEPEEWVTLLSCKRHFL